MTDHMYVTSDNIAPRRRNIYFITNSSFFIVPIKWSTMQFLEKSLSISKINFKMLIFQGLSTKKFSIKLQIFSKHPSWHATSYLLRCELVMVYSAKPSTCFISSSNTFHSRANCRFLNNHKITFTIKEFSSLFMKNQL